MKSVKPLSESAGRVLVTGSGGLVGRALTSLLVGNGFDVVRLTRDHAKPNGKDIYFWDPQKKYIDIAALRGVTHIVHLAGTNISEGRWTVKRKNEILESRVETGRLLYDTIIREEIPLRCFVSASGTGYYGNETGEKLFIEEDQPGNDFLARTCIKWEESAGSFRNSGIRTVVIRTAVVLSAKGGFMARLIPLLKARMVLWFGSGQQYFPWIHIDDLCNIYLKALLDNNMDGPYNAVAPQSVTQKEFMLCLARIKGKPALKAGIPSVFVNLVFGEMSSLLLYGSRVSASAIESMGYLFKYPKCGDALRQILHSGR